MTWRVVRNKGWHARTHRQVLSPTSSPPSNPPSPPLHPRCERVSPAGLTAWLLEEMKWDGKQRSMWCVTKEGLFDQWSGESAQSGADIERGSLGHCSHICLPELNINVWRSRAAERSSLKEVCFCCPAECPNPSRTIHPPARTFCSRLIVVGSKLEVRSSSVFHQSSLMR